MIIPLRRVGAGGDQENVTFLAPVLGMTTKLWGGPLGAEKEKSQDNLVNTPVYRTQQYTALPPPPPPPPPQDTADYRGPGQMEPENVVQHVGSSLETTVQEQL